MEITDQKRAEAARLAIETKVQQAQKLESLGVLSGGIAHDFNNILTGILGYADLALLQLGRQSAAAQSIDQVVLAARRAAELTRQLLAYSGKGQFIVEPIHLGELVSEMSQLLGLSISRKCLLQLDIEPTLPSVSADASQMRQVVMNLLLNASEAIGERNGMITMRLASRMCDSEWLAHSRLGDDLPPGLYVCIEVSDDGCGMPPETLAKIFDPFFTTKFTGRGLGLSAVLGIVRGHHGAIKVTSEVGAGTRFSVYLPASARPLVELRPQRTRRPAGFRGTGAVLVVDDEDAVRGLARSMLTQMGFQVLCASDGLEALQVVQAHPRQVRLVLLDLTMPRMDGEETLNALRALDPKLPIILTSGYNNPAASDGASPRGANGFIQKPYLYEQLSEVLRKALSDKRPRPRKPKA
jgi:nitrogen-specific signal transduction histidine kinase/CheY-like chemotaxis protein